MSTHSICGFVGDLTHFGAKTTYLRIKPRSGRIGASVRARERRGIELKARRNEEDRISDQDGPISVRPDRDGQISAEISWISAEMVRSRPRFLDLGRDFRCPDALKFLLLNLGPDWPDLGRDFCPRFPVRRFYLILGSVLAQPILCKVVAYKREALGYF